MASLKEYAPDSILLRYIPGVVDMSGRALFCECAAS
jgi:hypothetical protein